MARETDVRARSNGSLWRAPLAGGRSLDSWLGERTQRRLKDITNEPRVVQARRIANLPEEKRT